MGKLSKDIRSLCGQHAYDMRNAGYQLCRTKNTVKEECDKCYKQGYNYELKGGCHDRRNQRGTPCHRTKPNRSR